MTTAKPNIDKLNDDLSCDVFISGGGPVGLMLAIGLSRLGKKVVIAERFAPKTNQLESVQNSFDGRVLALSKGSQSFLEQIGVWSQLKPYTTAIEHIHVSQKGYLGITTLHAEEVDVDALGFSVQSSDLGQVLWGIAEQENNLSLLCPAQLESFTEFATGVKVEVSLEGESKGGMQTIHAQLIVGADGTQSKVREILELPIEEKSYDAFGVLAQIETEQHPHGWAYERFTQDGPVALLPMHGHAHKAVMVCSSEEVDAIKALNDVEYMDLFAAKMGERLGRFTKVSPRIVYPLKETYVPQMTKGRAVLMGNASHTQHPVAAQGLNLGIRDIEVFLKNNDTTTDLGDQAWLHEYAKSREPDHQKVMGLTDSLIQIFQHTSPLVGHLRGLGLMAMQAMPGVKRRFSKFAMRGSRA
ncbi:2-octaprenyl-6-methoxyphenol hydroxylase [Thiomicrorhabdus immobilis]|uniref:2-octaprenyl-6-methoxyphenol hydroxylase n=1 Tax=Thiomicrorhabdus immobilis TaxID=2791037 RepID=A0ABM7MDZ9_9GAMM|nr:FAD-dependent monooxygenase [Thiomicrorhabdus immobilis]BCN93637.1 2-octaprenyl-6-methoxyphenol hydroxylase [Thiomicrorhabdus immobilis]